ncbi:acyl-[acyl-carrier-protein] thioesterase [Fructilactobacillus sanfranciscensis]|uniref:ACP thioesterase n=1 Tax=Fructilactobacillus sanfranciscensis TaxID=1625 RepID=A0A5C4TK59_FRUSA|nr:acyl-ACP thioesterase domain-containing protein [Fructilactobacillus sanfranciscensis]TNK90528.1 ACP thioesterase [Fructilactobacillus sanfranciscensis]TNK95911.1 ACP thioesterase [Fructilactobacillus sanfranciscensis]
MAAEIFTEDYKITNFETNLHGTITLQYLLDVIVQASEDQSQAINLGTEKVQENGVTWVVIQYDVDIKELPKAGQPVKLQTQGTSYTKSFANRHFWIRDMDGHILVEVKSLWVMMNLTTRKMVRIPESVVTPYGSEKVKRLERLHKLHKFDVDNAKKMKFPVTFNDIDFNGHVGNTRYINWMSDTLSFDFQKGRLPTGFSIKFEDEVRYGDQVTSEVNIIDDGNTTVHQIMVDGKARSMAEITWKKIN